MRAQAAAGTVRDVPRFSSWSCVLWASTILWACGGSDSPSNPTNRSDAGNDIPRDGSPTADGGHPQPDGGHDLDAGNPLDAGTPGPDGGVADSGIDPGPVEALSDEFENASSLSEWSLRHVVEGGPAQYSTLDINGSHAGRATIVPTSSGWFQDGKAPFLFKLVTGDFVVQIHVNARNSANPNAAPTQEFNSAGLLARDPASVTGSENWIMYNVGFQSSVERVATERKSTVDSASALFFRDGFHSGRLAICRLGDTFRMFRRLDNENAWSEEPEPFVRSDLPDRLQVGITANGFSAPPDITAEFDYVRFSVPSSIADCTADIPRTR